MSTGAAFLAGGLAGVLLALAEIGWISHVLPLALVPVGEVAELLRAIAFRGFVVGAGAGSLVRTIDAVQAGVDS